MIPNTDLDGGTAHLAYGGLVHDGPDAVSARVHDLFEPHR